ncbi:MAG: SdpI family protein [Candidatus Micrarchaeota archaeon]|nr:SdpI family protein [Candidatus Micrarchaeota archaeon]
MVSRELLPIAIIALMFAIGFFAGPLVHTNAMGEMVSHWGADGQADGWIQKPLGLYMIPYLAVVFYVIFLLIPIIAVYRKNIEHFADQFWGFKVIFVFMMAAIYVATLAPALGIWGNFDPLYIIVPAIALLFFYVGHMLSFTRRNYFIGIRTPWTLADERVWEKTNHLGGKLFWVCGALALISLVSPIDLRLWIVLLPFIFAVVCVYFYSLYLYRQTKRVHERRLRAKGRRK